jgi:4-carboxymuconolactone decarboxylase
MSKLPKDIHPESGSRLPLPKREDMDDHGKGVFDRVVGPGSRVLAGLRGPIGLDLHSPKVSERQYALNQYLRYESGIKASVRELAILVAAREMNSQFEWTAHEPAALREGLSEGIIDIVRYRKSGAGLPETEAVIIKFGREMFRRRKVTSKTFARALNIFGSKQLVDLVALMASYASTALKLRAFDMQVDPDKKPLLPLIPPAKVR